MISTGDTISWQRGSQAVRTGTVTIVIKQGRNVIGYRAIDDKTKRPARIFPYQIRRVPT